MHVQGALHIKEQEELIAQCEEQCKIILELVDSDVLSVETEHFTGNACINVKGIILRLKCACNSVRAYASACLCGFENGNTNNCCVCLCEQMRIMEAAARYVDTFNSIL